MKAEVRLRMAKLGVIADGISQNFEYALDVMNEFELEYAELQFLGVR